MKNYLEEIKEFVFYARRFGIKRAVKTRQTHSFFWQGQRRLENNRKNKP